MAWLNGGRQCFSVPTRLIKVLSTVWENMPNLTDYGRKVQGREKCKGGHKLKNSEQSAASVILLLEEVRFGGLLCQHAGSHLLQLGAGKASLAGYRTEMLLQSTGHVFAISPCFSIHHAKDPSASTQVHWGAAWFLFPFRTLPGGLYTAGECTVRWELPVLLFLSAPPLLLTGK